METGMNTLWSSYTICKFTTYKHVHTARSYLSWRSYFL